MDVWIFHGWTCQCEGEFLAEEATRADSSGTKFEAAQAEWLRSWTYANLSWRKLQDVPSWKEQTPRSVWGVCAKYAFNIWTLNGDTCLFCVTSHPSSKLSTINPKLAITIHRVIYFGLDWQLVHHVLWCLMRITPPHSTATLILLHFIAILLKGNVHTHIIYIYTHIITYYYILLHIITYYYILLHSVTYYYILLHIITYYYILLHIITTYISTHIKALKK